MKQTTHLHAPPPKLAVGQSLEINHKLALALSRVSAESSSLAQFFCSFLLISRRGGKMQCLPALTTAGFA